MKHQPLSAAVPARPARSAGASRTEISPVVTGADRKAFLDLPYRAYRHLPAWRAPLRMERANQIDPARNPGLVGIDHVFFLARKNGEVAGRIAAFVNPAHLAAHGDGTGHFGFLDTLRDDPEVVAALLSAAEAWLRGRGMRRIAGPFNFSVNEECGLLVDGFDTPPMIMMPHGRPDYAGAVERAGYAKEMDLHAFLYEFGSTYAAPKMVAKWKALFDADPAVSVRPIDMSRFREEIALIMDMFNDAWSQNWGFVPFSDAQIGTMADELKPLITADAIWIASIDGEPATFTVFLPDLNELAHGLDGRLLPFGWARLLWRLKVRGATRARLPLFGLRRKFHKTRRGMLALAGSFESAFSAQYRRGVRQLEAGWVLETNQDLIGLIELFEMKRYKTYRIYGKAL